jgi:osmotically-inducible protein OsmY
MKRMLGTGLMVALLGSQAVAAFAEDPVSMEKEMAALRQEVAAELAKVPRLPGPFDYLTFTISGSVVTLEGFATGATLKEDAQRMVERIDWVTRVENEIEFHPSEPQADEIRRQVLEVLADKLPNAFPANYPDLRIQVDPELNVTIVGFLSPIERGRLEAALVQVRQLALVKSVDNQVLFKKER